jgi:hypothetical protein
MKIHPHMLRHSCGYKLALVTCFFFIIESTRLNPAARVFIVVVWRVVLMSKLRHGYATLDRDFGTV